MFDCIIVGSGPAGGAAAYHLAKQGRSVLVLEKECLPRYKPCGGGVSPIVGEWFDFDFSPAISSHTTTFRYTWGKEDLVEVDLKAPRPIWMVRRDIFDHFLIKQAVKRGAELRDKTEVLGLERQADRWIVSTAQGAFESRYLIAADGAKGPMAKWLGFTKRKRLFGGALEIEFMTDVIDPHAAYFEFGMVKNGYAWNFPKSDGYSIGIGVLHGGKAQNLKQLATDYSLLFGVDFNSGPVHAHPLCVWDGDQVLHTDYALLAGEAACVVDPLSAEGIRPSIFSGIKAAESIHAALAGESEALTHYTQVMAEEWGSEMRWARRLAKAFYGLPEVAYRLGVKNPSATRKLYQVFSGEFRYADLAGIALKRMGQGIIPGMS